MTVTEALVAIRRDIGDVGAVRWDDSTLLRYINDGRKILWQRRPYSFYVSAVVTSAPSDLTLTSSLDTLPHFHQALVDYTDFRALYELSEDANIQSLALQHNQKFIEYLG